MGSGVANRRERILYREVLPALVSQLAEETDSKPVQCEFESHRGHKKYQFRASTESVKELCSTRIVRRQSAEGEPLPGETLNPRRGVEDRWHRDPRRGEHVPYPADHPGARSLWLDKRHADPATLVTTARHGHGKRWLARWADHDGNA